MLKRIQENLSRQDKAFEVLAMLLEEEFAQLRSRTPEDVTHSEFAIHELMRQVAVEREEISLLLGGERLAALIGRIGSEYPQEAERIRELFERIDVKEQQCARMAEKNRQLVLGLLDQSQSLLDYLHDQVVADKKEENTYSARGKYRNSRPDPALVRGRL